MHSWKKTDALQVVTLEEGINAGKLVDFQFDLESFRVYGWLVKRGVWAGTGGVVASALSRIGKDVAFVTTEAAIEASAGARGTEDGRAWVSAWLKTRVMSRRGAAMGEVADVLFDASQARVCALVLDQNRVVRLDSRVALGRDAVILDDPGIAAVLTEKFDSPEWWTRAEAVLAG